MMQAHPTLTRSEILAIQDELIAEYGKREFQDRLHAALAAAGDDHARQNKARQDLCLPVQGSVIIKYGFEPTRKGVVESFLAMTQELKADPEVASKTARMSALVERYAAPDETWKSWPTSGEALHPKSPIESPQASPRPQAHLYQKTEEELEEERKYEQENHLAEAGIGIGMDSPKKNEAGPAANGEEKQPTLTKSQVMHMQDALIEEYQTEAFQDKLHAALAAAGDDPIKQMHARHEVCLPIQGPIIKQLGFEPSLKGVQQSFGALADELRYDPDIATRIKTMSVLVERREPHEERDMKKHADSEAKRAQHAAKHPAVHVEPMEGRFWKVVGGTHSHHHGLVVRKGQALSSPILALESHEARLSTGAVVTEMELAGDRLHYKKVAGDGPDFGWVSISLHGAALLEPFADPVEVPEA